MISIYLMGGLGNQLFQIFATIAYGIQYNHLFVFPYSDILVTGKVRPTYWHSFLKNLNIFTTNNPSSPVSNNGLGSFPRVNEKGFAHTKIPAISNTQNFILFGYYQSYKYFEKYQDQIYSMIMLSDKQLAIKTEYSDYFIEDSADSVRTKEEFRRMNGIYTISMHFRLGDYKDKQHCHPIMPSEYYVKSLEYILKNMNVTDIHSLSKYPNIRVLYFCEAEDNEYVSSVIEYLGNVFSDYTNLKFIKVDDTIEDWKQMLLMSCCDYNIIANSSFSWWAAYLNMNPYKIVCYPATWFGEVAGHDTRDLCPIEWNKITF